MSFKSGFESRDRESQFNTAGDSEFQVRGAAVLNDRLANDVRRNGTHSSGADDDRVLRVLVCNEMCWFRYCGDDVCWVCWCYAHQIYRHYYVDKWAFEARHPFSSLISHISHTIPFQLTSVLKLITHISCTIRLQIGPTKSRWCIRGLQPAADSQGQGSSAGSRYDWLACGTPVTLCSCRRRKRN